MINSEFYCTEELINLGFREVGKKVLLHKSCIVVGVENISIGDNVRIDGFNSIISSGNGFINLGSHIHIASHCYIGAGSGLVMEDFSGLAHGVKIHTMSDDYTGRALTNSTIPVEYKKIQAGKVLIGKHSIIGSDTVILPGVIISEGCSVGAMSLVTKSLDEWGVYFGIPAKRLKTRSKKLLELETQYLNNYDYSK
jgi:galactoside O-acetyltransferase